MSWDTAPPAVEATQFYSARQFARPVLFAIQNQLRRKTGLMECEKQTSRLPAAQGFQGVRNVGIAYGKAVDWLCPSRFVHN